jgi:hypothetical protein
MNSLRVILLPALLLAFPITALADSWEDESGHGKGRGYDRREYKEEFWDGNCKVERKLEKSGEYKEVRQCKALAKDESGHGKGRGHDRREYKEEFWDGNCKVERKLEKSGEYKEERKCKGHRHGYYEQAPVYVPAPPPVVVEPGITIRGTVRIPQ